jgi:hypothetical protein
MHTKQVERSRAGRERRDAPELIAEPSVAVCVRVPMELLRRRKQSRQFGDCASNLLSRDPRREDDESVVVELLLDPLRFHGQTVTQGNQIGPRDSPAQPLLLPGRVGRCRSVLDDRLTCSSELRSGSSTNERPIGCSPQSVSKGRRGTLASLARGRERRDGTGGNGCVSPSRAADR